MRGGLGCLAGSRVGLAGGRTSLIGARASLSPLRDALRASLVGACVGRAALRAALGARAVRAALRASLAALRASLIGARASLGPMRASLGALFDAPAEDGLLRSGLRGDILLGLAHFLAVNGYRGRAVVGGEGRDDVKTYAGEGEGVGVAGSLREGFVTGVVTLSPVLTGGVLPGAGEGEERSVRVVVDGGLDRRRP